MTHWQPVYLRALAASVALALVPAAALSGCAPSAPCEFAKTDVELMAESGTVSDVIMTEEDIARTWLCRPVFAGDYATYLSALNMRRQEEARLKAEEEERKRLEEEAAREAERKRLEEESGKNTEGEADIGNVSSVPVAVELPPPIPVPPVFDPNAGYVPDAGYIPSKDLPIDYQTLTWQAFDGKSITEKVNLMGAIARQDMHESGILASITTAQCILESGWMKSGLAKHNGMFGIKACKMENNWEESTWDGSAVNMKTGEEYTPGTITTITAAFRTYPSVWASVKDHSAYLKHSKKGNAARYPGVVGNRDPRATIQIIKDGGYATSSGYVDYIMKIVDMYGLTKFDY